MQGPWRIPELLPYSPIHTHPQRKGDSRERSPTSSNNPAALGFRPCQRPNRSPARQDPESRGTRPRRHRPLDTALFDSYTISFRSLRCCSPWPTVMSPGRLCKSHPYFVSAGTRSRPARVQCQTRPFSGIIEPPSGDGGPKALPSTKTCQEGKHEEIPVTKTFKSQNKHSTMSGSSSPKCYTKNIEY